MSNEITVNQTITALYANILELEAKLKQANHELEDCNNYIWTLQQIDNEMREGFKKYAYHLPVCMAIFTKEPKDCDCSLKEFAEVMKIV